MRHIEAAKVRLENLWAAGTDYCERRVGDAKPRNAMLHLDMDLTGECDLKCFYCDRTPDRFNKIKGRLELTTAERTALVDQAKALGAEAVELPGAGEPMIDPGFWSIVEHTTSRDMTPVVFTSGNHLDASAVDRLYDLGATVFVKYNHSNALIQDKMVGLSGYGDRVSSALRLMLEKGFNRDTPTRLAIDMVVTPKYHDLNEIERVFRWCRHNNIHSYIQTLIPEGMSDRKQLILERERADALITRLQKIDEEEFGLKYSPSRPMAGGYRCRQVNVGLFVNLFGEVYDCNGLGRFVGHVRTDSLADIWNARYARDIRTPRQDGFCLVRERVWQGIDTSGMERKLEEFQRWRMRNGTDPVVERGFGLAGIAVGD